MLIDAKTQVIINDLKYPSLKSRAVGTGALSSVTSFCHDTIFSAL